MDIYVVQPGDNIYSIAERYGVTVYKLVQDNGLNSPFNLVIGQTIVIAYPKQIYTVQEGDTLNSIADAYKVTLIQILRNNPYLSDREYIYPGETIVISYNTNGSITTNGFAYPYIKRETLVKVLPSLTYLSVFNYTAIEKGDIITYSDDAEIIQTTKEYGVIPLLMIATLTTQGEPNIEVAYEILLSEEYQEHHINMILDTMIVKGYYGVNIVFNYMKKINMSLYMNFIKKISNRLQSEGYLFFITINQKIENINNEILFEQIDYADISKYVTGMIFLQLVWGTNYGPPAPVSSINEIRTFIDYVASMVSSDKIIIGSTTISYDWQLPYIPSNPNAVSLTIDSVINLAQDVGATIQFDETSQTPFFLYNQITSGAPTQHIVWTIDARSIDALEKLMKEYSLNGIGIWNIMTYYSQFWTLINSQYEIVKIIP